MEKQFIQKLDKGTVIKDNNGEYSINQTGEYEVKVRNGRLVDITLKNEKLIALLSHAFLTAVQMVESDRELAKLGVK